MSYVQFGNDTAREGRRVGDAATDEVEYTAVEGQRVTLVTFDDSIPLLEAFQTSVAQVTAHLQEGTSPKWVESDSAGLKALLDEHFGTAGSSRPKNWGGKALRANEFIVHPDQEN